ncbi:cold shock domain-containing protein [Rhodoblastus acidophilus]|uniref:Cold shock domain-containing protein n=1 Tax=Candidatus Rhodoblastus alkanivorans TaxID=2954117 RepID=A0ABS9Z702_9HYPH|nr:HPF/RaiA family ribosome-associated protein [Candidatus Rhodoblastus alkanivorans]MCI4679164.1 cold shock domain-containing protein [Candidatus Rhodoblastus alkanivorans]MCI4683160.1 cold shock domain-containing protein [Candidatus Rhodoblastus alkanivorans]MDI4640471.1 cold shock domain-containing protein [Rhodoblastus acidophilus]
MQTPPEVAFHHFEPSDAVRAEVARQLERLEKFSDRITSCHFAVTKNARRQHGDLFHVALRVAMPGRKDIVVDKSHGDAPEHEHALVAVRDAFDAAIRQIEDAMRDLRDKVKLHEAPAHGRVARFLAGENCGFIETPDGREIYFHRNSVVEGDFDKLETGSEVRFVEEIGEKGAQASTVRVIGKHHLP